MVSSIKRTNQATYITGYACCCVCVSGWLMGIVMCLQAGCRRIRHCRSGCVGCRNENFIETSWTYQEHIIGFNIDME
jgi:hypothetical protein